MGFTEQRGYTGVEADAALSAVVRYIAESGGGPSSTGPLTVYTDRIRLAIANQHTMVSVANSLSTSLAERDVTIAVLKKQLDRERERVHEEREKAEDAERTLREVENDYMRKGKKALEQVWSILLDPDLSYIDTVDKIERFLRPIMEGKR
jgi:hypothetical protein